MDDRAVVLFDPEGNEAGRLIRRQWHDGQWYFSVIDVVRVLTDSPDPRTYWAVLKNRLQKEGANETLQRCKRLKLRAPDGKLRETNCADVATMMVLLFTIPAWRRNPQEPPDEDDTGGICDAGIYAITNVRTHEQYIGSSYDIPLRFKQHLSRLRRGKHHAKKFQEAWDVDGEQSFTSEVLERIPVIKTLSLIEQQYFARYHPSYNGAPKARNSSALPPVSSDRLSVVIAELTKVDDLGERHPFLRAVMDALVAGALRPGPKFHLLLETEQTPAAEKVC